MGLHYITRPLGLWTEGDTTDRRSRSTFKANWNNTLLLLGDEIWYLDGKNVVLAADFRERDIRIDGMIRADARQPQHPGVRVSFDSAHGPLTYATDAHVFWQHNVRGIALALVALRAVDRYGVTRRGEQYRGWSQLPAGATPMPAPMTRVQAMAAVAEWIDLDVVQVAALGPDDLRRWFRKARAAAHPDANAGLSDGFLKLERAGFTLGLVSQ